MVSYRTATIAFLLLSSIWRASAADGRISGRVTDPQHQPVAGAHIELSAAGRSTEAASDADGRVVFAGLAAGDYTVRADAPGFRERQQAVRIVDGGTATIELRFDALAEQNDSVTVSEDVKDIDVQSPDPAEKVFASADLLDAN